MSVNIGLTAKVSHGSVYSYFHIMQQIWLVLLWGLYFLHHSLFAATSVKALLLKKGISLRLQRIVYSIFSTIGLLLVLLYNGVLGGEKMLAENRLIKAFAFFLATGGVFIVREAFKVHNLRSFLGASQRLDENLKTDGILRYIRHPLYSATILIFIGFFLYDSRMASLISLLCVLIYLPIGIWLEEKKLVILFGERYERYAKEVPMLFPNFKNR